jgi:hypothetical protein
MSVDTTAGFAFGWVITREDKEAMIETYHETTGNYNIEDCFIQVNAYRSDTAYIFGEWVSYFPEPGHVRKFHLDEALMDFDKEGFFNEYIPMLRDAGKEHIALNIPASFWTVHSVW